MALPPGPRGPALVNLVRYALRPDAFFARGRARYGPSFSCELAGMGRLVFLGEPAAIRDVFLGDPEVLSTGAANAFVAEHVGTSSLLTLDGEPHARARRALIPPLHGEQLDAHVPLLRDLCQREVDRWKPGRRVQLEDACREITLQAILHVVFGVEDGPEHDALAADMRRIMQRFAHPLAFAAALVPERLRALTGGHEIARLEASIDEALLRLIARKRASAQPGGDVLGALLAARGPDGAALGDRALRDHLFTMLLAGHDTTAIALAWALGEILDRPELSSAILAELRDVVGAGELEVEHVRELHLLDAAIKESMRLRPLVDFSVRLLRAPFQAAGVTYPAGVTLAPCTLLVHRREDLYPEPLAFRPERFLRRRPDPYAWIPFGGGRRRCLGMNFALFQMRVVLATILTRVRFAPRERRPVRVARRGLFLAPADRAAFRIQAIAPRGEPLRG